MTGPAPNGPAGATSGGPTLRPRLLTADEVEALHGPKAGELVVGLIGSPGLTLMVGPAKVGKTLLSLQTAFSVTAGVPLFGCYPIPQPGPAAVILKDDPSGVTFLKDLFACTPVPFDRSLFSAMAPADAARIELGDGFCRWLDQTIARKKLRLVVLDSYSSLRATRPGRFDVVKVESDDLAGLDRIAKARDVAILLLHHPSKTASRNHWSERAAGSFAMAAASEGQIFLDRFDELGGSAPERLLCARGRHFGELSLVLRFDPQTLSFAEVMRGPAAPFYPDLRQIARAFPAGTPFTPKEISQALGWSRATTHRRLGLFAAVNAVAHTGYGNYVLVV